MSGHFVFTVVIFLAAEVFASQSKEKSLSQDSDVVVDLTASSGEMKRVWDNTGLSPPGPGEDAVKYLSSKDQFLNLALIGSLPFKGISHVRIHWLLDLINVNFSDDENEWKFSQDLLDQLINWLRLHRLRPAFELMGNPGKLFNDLNTNPKTLVLWQLFVTQLTNHYIAKFGKEEVRKWRFELWNEPDSKQYNILNLTTSGYLKYAYASMRGLLVNDIKVSGPAGTFRDFEHHNLSWSLLQMCNTMISLAGSCGLETITFHKKGKGSAQEVVTSSIEFYSLATTIYPMLKTLPFVNNEADILVGWWREEEWRGDVNYAAEVCEVLTSLLAEVKMQNLSLAYISNDNGFINQPPAYFNQRTLLTRFQMNCSEDGHSQFVRKPVMVAMAMLSYLGSKELPVFVRHLSSPSNCDSRLSVLAAGEGVNIGPGWSAAVIVAVSALRSNCSQKQLQLTLKLPSDTELTYVVYQLDNVVTNPKKVWEENGKPIFPSADLLQLMRKQEGPHFVQSGRVVGDWEVLSLLTRCPSVSLIHLCVKTQKPPAKVLQLHAVNITFNEVLLLWQDSDTKCVKTYEVYFCPGVCLLDEYRLITDRDIVMLSYQFRLQMAFNGTEATRGRYKVRVRDYWDQLSIFSDVLLYP